MKKMVGIGYECMKNNYGNISLPESFNGMGIYGTMDKLIDIVKEAAEAIDRRIRKEDKNKFGLEIEMGADGTPTLYIDKVAEEEALDVIGNEANILSEEIGFIDNGKEYTIVMDPIDGTRNAFHGIPFYGISMAIGKKATDDVEYGIVKNIPTGDIYEAYKGNGAYLNGRRIEVSRDYSDIIYCLTLGESGNEKTWKLANLKTIRAMGAAALEMCLVASGAVHAYFMPKESLRVTDFAAGCLIVREAGGEVYNADGEILNVPFDLKIRSSVLAVASKDILEELI